MRKLSSSRLTRPDQPRTWASTTNAILALRDDLLSEQVTLVVMEATSD